MLPLGFVTVQKQLYQLFHIPMLFGHFEETQYVKRLLTNHFDVIICGSCQYWHDSYLEDGSANVNNCHPINEQCYLNPINFIH